MASNVKLEIDSTEVPVELREGSIANNTNDGKAAAASVDKTASSSTGAVDKKTGKVKDGKKSSSPRHGRKNHSKAKTKKTKKSAGARNTSSSESEASGSDSSSGSELSDSDAEETIRTSSIGKKRHNGKTKRSAAKPGRKARKQSSRVISSSDYDSKTGSSGSDTDSSADVTDAVGSRRDRGGKKQKTPMMQLQIDAIQRQLQELQRGATPAGLGLGNAGSLNGLPINSGLLGSGGPGAWNFNLPPSLGAGALGSAALGGLNGVYGGLDQGLGHRRGLLNGTRPPPPRGARKGHPGRGGAGRGLAGLDDYYDDDDDDDSYRDGNHDPRRHRSRDRGRRRPQRLDFKRVDQVWDSQIHNYKLQDTAENADDAHYNEYLFHVRRTFDWEGKYKTTIVDIKSKQLREALQDVMGNIKGVSLVEDTPKLDPNMLFLYLEDLREHLGNLQDLEPDAKSRKERKKVQKWIDQKRRHLRVLVKYLDKDYALIKKSLYPLLENGLITFDLCWALWKPNTLAYTTTYGSVDEPRVFKVDIAEKHHSIIKGDYYYIEGKYFEFDGKQFGYGSMSEETSDFRGARKISSLSCYPLKYHKNETQLRKDLIDRGKKFVSLAGAHYKSHQGIAYYKKKKSIVKVNINGRIMVDPSTHRRNNPNYPISLVRPKDHDLLSDPEDSDEEEDCCGFESDDADDGGKALIDSEDRVRYVTKMIKDKNGNIRGVRLPKSELEDGNDTKLDNIATDGEADGGAQGGDEKSGKDDKGKDGGKSGGDDDKIPTPEFADEEYLIASPVVLGFAFAEKLWLELSVSGVKEISWNESAYDSLVLEPKTKDIVKALVESHKYHAAESIDDVIQGKGKGLVFVLHGPPGTGKTLTAEGISELLKCPLYNVSAGDLGTDSRLLEMELQKVLDICHAWGAILLLDEADVFLEKRNMHDIHRNALVSIFLRQLEYFQGILFLTTNRVETFDDAFQSRIHIALRYDDLDTKAKKAIFKIFIERVRALKEVETEAFTEEDYNTLARHTLNGRQIKNTIRTAQALAVNRGEPLGMRHIAQFLDVLQSFERDLKGGTGYQEAMRSYF